MIYPSQNSNDPAKNFQEEAVLDKDITFSVFNGGQEITPQMYEEVKRFAEYAAQLKQQ